MINRVVLVGRMTRDPELRRTQNGSAVTSFTLAINRPKRNDEEQQADYISCVVWNKTAEIVEKAAHIYCICETMGGAKLLPESDIAIMHDFYKQHYSKRQIEKGDDVLE